MYIGKMDRTIVIGTYTTSRNSSGEEVRSYTYTSKLWCAVSHTSGSESFEADQKVGTEVQEFTLRYRAVAQNATITYNSIVYDILSVEEIDRKRFIKITAKKRNNG
jgi:SPP1 family predicted phage head-tail adaptor